jgi:hypothetical protein
MMLFEPEKPQRKAAARPALPAGTKIDYEIGFLFNFVSPKSTRFDLEPVLIYNKTNFPEYKRISLQVDRG